MNAPVPTFFAQADSARAAGEVYSVSLVATLPVIVAVIAFFCLRRSNAGARAIVWRCAMTGLLVVYAGSFVRWQWTAWILPELLARPLVTLGTIQLGAQPGMVSAGEPVSSPTLVRGLLALYWSGVVLVLLRTVIARVRLAVAAHRASVLDGQRWRTMVRDAGIATGVSTGAIRLLASPVARVPVTWGLFRPVIVLPTPALCWADDRLQAVLRHELAHIGAGDATMRLTSRVACALFWFHPGVWWLARRFEADAEEACDDRVLASGIRASDYAELLAASTPSTEQQPHAAMALSHPGNLRARLAAVTDTHRRLVLPGRRVVFFAVAMTVAIAAPLSTARLAPTRGVLTSLMQDTRWESRAWAVVRLARRADSVHVARSAATHDPDPAVRAWARYALGLMPTGATTRAGS